MDAEGIVKLLGGGVAGSYGLRLLWQWLSRERQESSLYKNEVEAHAETRKELIQERQMRKDAEMELRHAREEHDRDRETWFQERQLDREARDALREEVSKLRAEITNLRTTVTQLQGGVT